MISKVLFLLAGRTHITNENEKRFYIDRNVFHFIFLFFLTARFTIKSLIPPAVDDVIILFIGRKFIRLKVLFSI